MINRTSICLADYSSIEEVENSNLHQFLPVMKRTEYKQWVVEWKAVLKEINLEIREAKRDRRYPKNSTEEKNGANLRRQRLRVESNNMQGLRKLGKIRAAQAWQAEKLALA